MKFELKIITPSQVYRTITKADRIEDLLLRIEMMYKREHTYSFTHTSEYCISGGECEVILPVNNIEAFEIRELNDN